jgi:glucans biosynthesis protein C
MLVVLHHVALTYGAHSGWYYYEPTGDPATNAILTVFLAVNRVFFMGTFFMVSGYFTPGPFDRKGAGRFLADRLLRLGIPLFFFSFIVRPVLVYTMNLSTLGTEYSFWANLAEFRNVAPGPLWFVEVLLIFSGGYVLWRAVRRFSTGEPKHIRETRLPGTGSIVGFVLVVSVITFLIRIYYPPSREWFHLRIGNYAQYVSLYIVGIVAYRQNWITAITGEMGRLWALIAAVALFLYVMLTVHGLRTGTLATFSGGLHRNSLLGALNENFLCMGIMISLLYFLRKKWNFQGKLTTAMARDAYTVYIMHTPVIVYFTYLIKPLLSEYPLLKFWGASIAGLVLSFLISHWIRMIPFAKKVL